MMAMPVICDVGYEAWRAKEAKLEDAPGWGDVTNKRTDVGSYDRGLSFAGRS